MLQDTEYEDRDTGESRSSASQAVSGRATVVRRLAPYLAPQSGVLARQHTVRNRIVCSGVGLHSGKRVTMAIAPAPTGSGIIFRRSDLAGPKARRSVDVLARYDCAIDLVLGTNIVNEAGLRVGTIEHLMAALSGQGIDNALIELDGPEVPVMDGSAAPFVFLLECADREEQAAPRRYIEILKRVEVRERDEQGQERSALLEPGPGFGVRLEIDFDNVLVGAQRCDFLVDEGIFKAEISRARTFGFFGDVERLHAKGLALGGSLDNAVVVDGGQVLNEGGLRYGDEFVRHKALDAIGDLYMAGAPILGRFTGRRTGHSLNNRLLQALFADETAWRYTFQPTPRRADDWPEPHAATGRAAIA